MISGQGARFAAGTLLARTKWFGTPPPFRVGLGVRYDLALPLLCVYVCVSVSMLVPTSVLCMC